MHADYAELEEHLPGHLNLENETEADVQGYPTLNIETNNIIKENAFY
jgi:hypothetical protein